MAWVSYQIVYGMLYDLAYHLLSHPSPGFFMFQIISNAKVNPITKINSHCVRHCHNDFCLLHQIRFFAQ